MYSENKSICPSCRATLEAGAQQCTWCLTKLGKQTAAPENPTFTAEPQGRRSKPSWGNNDPWEQPPVQSAYTSEKQPTTSSHTQPVTAGQQHAPSYAQIGSQRKNWLVRLFAIIDLVASLFFLFVIIGMVMAMVDAATIGSIAIFWMLLHTIFAIILVVTAKSASITRRLSVIHLVLNILLIGIFACIIIWVVVNITSDGVYMTDSMQTVSGIIILLWFLLAILAPVIILIVSLVDRKYSKKANLQQMASTLQ